VCLQHAEAALRVGHNHCPNLPSTVTAASMQRLHFASDKITARICLALLLRPAGRGCTSRRTQSLSEFAWLLHGVSTAVTALQSASTTTASCDKQIWSELLKRNVSCRVIVSIAANFVKVNSYGFASYPTLFFILKTLSYIITRYLTSQIDMTP
jgi:hypothetical protein